MKHLAAIVVASAAVCASSSRAAPQGSTAAAPSPAERIERIERGLMTGPRVRGEDAGFTLAERMRKYRVPAVSIAVFFDYELQWAKAYGSADVETGQPATEDTTFLAGSISKSVHALGVMLAAADGTVSLDQPINELLGEWKLPENDLTRRAPVTLRKLLSHTAGTTVHGFPGYVAGSALPTVEQILDGEQPANTKPVRVDLAPGTEFRYSGGGTTISQLALTQRAGRPYPEIMHERVLGPLGMEHSSFDQTLTPERLAHAAAGHTSDGQVIPGKRNAYPEMAAAGLWTTPSDLARFFIELARARAGQSSIVSRAIATEMTTPVAEVEDGAAVGLGVFLEEKNGAWFFGHGGADAGFLSFSTVSLDGGHGLVIMTNSNEGHRLFPEIERAVFAEYGWEGGDPELVRFALPPQQLARVAGSYLVVGQPLTISARGDRIELESPFMPAVELVPVAADRLVSREDGAEYRLEATGDTIVITDPRGGPPAKATRLDSGARLPILELEAGRFDAAVALWTELEAANPDQPAVDENYFNALGYALMEDDPAAAVLVLRMVQAAEPDSANAWDSLADAYKAAGQPAKAIAAYEAALRLLEADPRLSPGRKADLRTHEEAELARLRAEL